MSSKELETTQGTNVALPEDVQALLAQQEEEFEEGLFTTPILKIGQPLTREVQNDQAEAGEFINTLTGDGLGDKIGFIVAYYHKGRLAVDDDGRTYVAFQDTIPEQWEDFVGEEFVGTPFTEYPDAEEQFKARVNRKEIAWGSGPAVSTTHNFTGLAIVPAVEGEEDDRQPVRLSLKRTDMPSVRKLMTIKRAVLRNRPFWDIVFDLSTEKNTYGKGSAFNLAVKQGRATDAVEREEATALAQAVIAGRTVDNFASDSAQDAPVEPDAKGGLEV